MTRLQEIQEKFYREDGTGVITREDIAWLLCKAEKFIDFENMVKEAYHLDGKIIHPSNEKKE